MKTFMTLLFLSLWGSAALAQTLPCAARDRVLALVIDQRGETRLATGDAL